MGSIGSEKALSSYFQVISKDDPSLPSMIEGGHKLGPISEYEGSEIIIMIVKYFQ